MRNRKVKALVIAMAAMAGISLCGCGNKIDADATFATLDDTEITMGVANFCAKYQQAMYDSFYASYFGDDMWNQDLYGNGNTLEQDIKSEVAENIREMYILKAHMAEYDVTISEEEESEIAKAADEFISESSNSKKAIEQIGAENREDVIEMLRLNTIKNKMHNSIMEEADVEVTDKEAAQRSFSYVVISTAGHYDDESNYLEYTEEEIAELKAKADKIAKADDFDKAITDEGYTVSTASYGSAEDENPVLNKTVLEMVDTLKEGEISGVIETEGGYYVARLDSEYDKEATETKKESMIETKKEEYYQDILSGWKDAAKWTINESEWEKVTFKDRFIQKAADTENVGEEAVLETEAQ